MVIGVKLLISAWSGRVAALRVDLRRQAGDHRPETVSFGLKVERLDFEPLALIVELRVSVMVLRVWAGGVVPT